MSVPYLDVMLYQTDEHRVPLHMFSHRIGGPDNELGFWMNRKENKACVALDEATGLCTIYEDRPIECREFNQDHPVCKEVRG
jgi:hypothetical protein